MNSFTWFTQLFTQQTPAGAILLISIAVALGVALGKIRVFGISIGIAGVLFSGILVGHFGGTLDHHVLHFTRELGLIFFVFSIGLAVGPGFFTSFRKSGLKLNMLAAGIVLGGVAIAASLVIIFKQPVWEVIGVLCGSVTNTPSLGAAQQAMKDQGEVIMKIMQITPGTNVAAQAKVAVDAAVSTTGMGYAVAYPFGIMGIILTMLLVRFIFRVKVSDEVKAWKAEQQKGSPSPQNHNFLVKNPQMEGMAVKKLRELVPSQVVITRILRAGKVFVPKADTTLKVGDLIHVVGPDVAVENLRLTLGDKVTTDVRTAPGKLETETLVVSHHGVVGKRIAELNYLERHGVIVSRISRSGITFVPSGTTTIELGDQVTVVGEDENILKVSLDLGNSSKELQHPNVLPLFIGVLLGVIVGSIPLFIPGLPAPVKLGLAGGPLLIAILLGWVGRVGPISFYVPSAASLILREAGIVLFLACVGIYSGKGFVDTLIYGKGPWWMLWGVAFTLIPILVVGILSRAVFKLNYLQICGLLAGSMTDPPALGFANAMAPSDAQAVTYASVYPFTMFLRIMTAQVFVILLLSHYA